MRRPAAGLLTALLGCVLAGCGPAPEEAHAPSREHARQVMAARQQRLAAFFRPNGFLSYLASGRLGEGRFAVGSARGNPVRLPEGPAHLGWLEVAGREAHFLHPDGRRQPMPPAEGGRPPGARLAVGGGHFFLMRNGDYLGWRFQQPGAAARHPFRGFAYFPVDPRWRITAKWLPFPKPVPRAVMSSQGTVMDMLSPGEARFAIDGKAMALRPVFSRPGDNRLLFLFSDRTSGKETFGGGRYLFVDPPEGSTLELDFNLAQNPVCAVTVHVICPVPPPDAFLDAAIRAGEKDWHQSDTPAG